MAFGGGYSGTVRGEPQASIQGGKIEDRKPEISAQGTLHRRLYIFAHPGRIHPYVFADRFCGFTWTGWNDRSPCNPKHHSNQQRICWFEGVRPMSSAYL